MRSWKKSSNIHTPSLQEESEWLYTITPREGSDPQWMSHQALGNTASLIRLLLTMLMLTKLMFTEPRPEISLEGRKWEHKSKKGGRWHVWRKSHEQPDLLQWCDCHITAYSLPDAVQKPNPTFQVPSAFSVSMLVTPSLLISIHQLANLFQEGW